MRSTTEPAPGTQAGRRQRDTKYPVVAKPGRRKRPDGAEASLRNWTNCGFPERRRERTNRRYRHPLAPAGERKPVRAHDDNIGP